MTACARRIEPPDRSANATRQFRAGVMRWITGMCLALSGMAVRPALAQPSVLIDGRGGPAAADGGSFERITGGGNPVIVGDDLSGGIVTDSTATKSDEWGSSENDVPADETGWPIDGQSADARQFPGVAGDWDHGEWCDAFDPSGAEPCGGPCHRGCRRAALWAIQAEALVLWRGNFSEQPLFQDALGAVALDAGDVRTPAASGPRIGVLRSLGCGRAIEGNYFNVGGIRGSTITPLEGGPYTAIGLADLVLPTIETATYTTQGQIKSAELNYRWCQGRRVIWLAGFRWIEWNETGTVDYVPTADVPDLPGIISSQVGNDLYGGQFGCRLRLWDLGKWQVGAVGKAGGFGNTAFQRTTAVVDGGPLGPIGATATDVAFFGEVGVNSTLWINRWLAWRAGYNFFWLEGVATAAQQLPLGDVPAGVATISTNGSVFLQGFSTGLEARW